MKMDNPFLIRGYAGPEYFCDRVAETQKLVSAISNGRDVTLVAPRRYGKTGLIRNAFRLLGKNHATVYLDIFAIENMTSFVQAFSSAVLGSLDSPAERIGRKAKGTLKDTFDYIASRKRKVAIAIDEFQQIREFPEGGVEALLRSYIQFTPNAHFIFAGSKKHMMDAMFVSPKGPFYQSTQLMTLDVIDIGKYETFAKGFFHDAGRSFDSAAFCHLYNRFSGITWYIQAILNRVWAHGSGLDSAKQVDDTVDELVSEAESFYFDLFRSQTSAEQSILKAVGREGTAKSISAGDFIRRHSLPAASTVRSAAAKLKERDLLYKTDAGYVVYDRFFGLWLKHL